MLNAFTNKVKISNMSERLDLRQFMCKKCDYTGWIMHDPFGKQLTYMKHVTYRTKDGNDIDMEMEYSYAKECQCLLKIRAGHYN